MKFKTLSFIFFCFFSVFGWETHAQCNVAIPSTATVIDAPGMSVSGVGKSVWLCDSLLSSSGVDNIYFIESGAYYKGSGIRITSYVKSGGIYDLNGLNDTVYHEPGAIFLNQPAMAIPCASLLFDYTNAPASNCLIQLPDPMAGFTVSKDTICINNCLDFTDTSVTTGTTTWQWNFEGGTPATSLLKTPTNICYDSAGTFAVQLIVNDSVSADTASFSVYVEACLSLLEKPLTAVSVFPNPAGDVLRFTSSYPVRKVEVTDLYGKTYPLPLRQQQLSVSELPPGVYYLKVTTDMGLTNSRFIKL